MKIQKMVLIVMALIQVEATDGAIIVGVMEIVHVEQMVKEIQNIVVLIQLVIQMHHLVIVVG